MPYFSVPTNDPEVKRSSVVSMEHFAEKATRLKALREQMGRSNPFDLAVRPPVHFGADPRSDAERFRESAHQLKSYGVNWIWAVLPSPNRAAFLENVAFFGEEIVARFPK